MIELKNVSKTYASKRRTKKVLDNISLDFSDTGIVGIVGESGVGKTTLINIISGIDKCYTGKISINKIAYSSLSDYDLHSNIAYLKQNEKLIPYLTIQENLEYFYKIDNLNEVLNRYNIDVSLDKYPTELSGGEQQRLAILQAVIEKKKVLLLDEPTASLDDNNSIKIMELIQTISQDILVILISHDDKIINKYCVKIVEIKDGMICSEKNNHSLEEHSNLSISATPKSNKKVLVKSSLNFVKKHKGLMLSFSLIQLLIFLFLSIVSSLLNYNSIEDVSSHINNNYYGVVYKNEVSYYSGNDHIYNELTKEFNPQNVIKTVSESFLVSSSSSYKKNTLSYICILDDSLEMNKVKMGAKIFEAITGKTNIKADYKLTLNKPNNGAVLAEKNVTELLTDDIIYVSSKDYTTMGLNHFNLKYIEQTKDHFFTIYKNSDYNVITNKPVYYSSRQTNILKFENPKDNNPYSKYDYVDLSNVFPTGLEVEVKTPTSTFSDGSLVVSDSIFESLLNKNKNYDSLFIKVDNKNKIAKYYSNNDLFFAPFSYFDSYSQNKENEVVQNLNTYINHKSSIRQFKYLSYVSFAVLGIVELIILLIHSNKIDFIKREENDRLLRKGIKKSTLFLTNVSFQIIMLLVIYSLSLIFIALFKHPLSHLFQNKQSTSIDILLISFYNNFIIELGVFTLILIAVLIIKYLSKKELKND